ncbi:MAG: SHOCT domain-containing protein [Bacteroidota bacterium]|jgi:hypothetical protein
MNTLLTMMGGQEWTIILIIFIFLLAFTFWIFWKIRENAKLRTENRLLKKQLAKYQLAEFDQLRKSGVLTEEEFIKKKSELLND